MSTSTKSQFYRYSMKTVVYLNAGMCTNQIYAYPVPPDNALSIENLFIHFQILFDSGVAAADRKIERIGIANDRPTAATTGPTIVRYLDVNLTADANRTIDVKIDLSSLLDKTKVDFDDIADADYTTGDKTLVYIKMPDSLISNVNVGSIKIWKIDTTWTTQEIR